MKRHLNTSYRLVWNHITGTLVVITGVNYGSASGG
nr:ESPR-type extended signal peptide-containing protein [Escherichia coli]